MKVLSWPQEITGVVLDVDGTIYVNNSAYTRHQRQVELQALARHFGEGFKETVNRVNNKSQELQAKLKREPSAGEIVRALGLTQDWLTVVRNRGWCPERYLKPQTGLPGRMLKLVQDYRVALVSTSPRLVVNKILKAIGLEAIMDRMLVMGAEDSPPKPDPAPYRKAASLLGVEPAQCLSVGDRLEFDCRPAILIGMGAVLVEQDLPELLDKLLEVSSHAVSA